MSALFTSVVLAMALITHNLAKESQNDGSAPPKAVYQESAVGGALYAPKTAFLSLDEYAAHAARDAGIDPVQFQRLVMCESQWKEDAAGDNGTSLGLLQFKRTTFAHFSRKYVIQDADVDNPHHQIDLAAGMIADGYLHHWKNCSRKIGWSEQ